MTTTTHRWHRTSEDSSPSAVTTDTPRGSRTRRLWRGRPEDPSWVRPALFGLLAATAVLYLWNLSVNGYANSFYSAAVQAGSDSWKAFFFGSSDAANSITVDKPPASLWVMALSVRIFGLSSWAILAPQALMGVATVGVVYAAVRRAFSPVAGLLAGAVLALTPVATLMFRFNNPDAMLVLVMTVAAYCVLRAVEDGRTRWLVATGVLVGLGFLTKQLQVFLVLPPLALTYLIAAPHGLVKRIRQLLIGGLAMVLAAGWWIAVVELVPASMRPYIGGSQDNSILELTFGYNGLGRLSGNETGSVGGGGGTGGGMWGETGITRLFTGDFGGQIAWLAPAALILLVAGLFFLRKAPRIEPRRAAFIVWGTWLLTTGLVFSFMQGIFHQYYTVALAPAIAALVGIGADTLWRRRHESVIPMGLLGLVVGVTAAWSFVLLDRSADFLPWLRWAVLVVGLVAGCLIALSSLLGRRILMAAAATAVIVGLAGPAAYSLDTVSSAKTGSIVTAGPSVASSSGFGGGRGGMGGGPGGGGQPPTQNGTQGGTTQGGATQGGTGTTQGGTATQGGTGTTTRGGGGGGAGGLLNGATVSDDLVQALEQDADSYTWVAAAVGSQNAASYQLATEDPVMALGGFNGSDPSPTLAQFQEYVAQGKIHYFIGSGSVGGGSQSGGSSASSEIASWVSENFTATTVGGTTVYDLSGAATAS